MTVRTIDVVDQAGVTRTVATLPDPGTAADSASLPVAFSTEGKAQLGSLTETAPATDTASSGQNGRLQRIAQRITSLIALLPAALGIDGGLKVSIGGNSDTLNVTTATVIKASAGRLAKVSVIVAGTTDGTVNDCLTTGAAAASNQFGAIPAAVGVNVFDWPCGTGIVVVPGTGQTLAVSYS